MEKEISNFLFDEISEKLLTHSYPPLLHREGERGGEFFINKIKVILKLPASPLCFLLFLLLSFHDPQDVHSNMHHMQQDLKIHGRIN